MDRETEKHVKHYIQVKYKGEKIINLLLVTQFMTLNLILTTKPI